MSERQDDSPTPDPTGPLDDPAPRDDGAALPESGMASGEDDPVGERGGDAPPLDPDERALLADLQRPGEAAVEPVEERPSTAAAVDDGTTAPGV